MHTHTKDATQKFWIPTSWILIYNYELMLHTPVQHGFLYVWCCYYRWCRCAWVNQSIWICFCWNQFSWDIIFPSHQQFQSFLLRFVLVSLRIFFSCNCSLRYSRNMNCWYTGYSAFLCFIFSITSFTILFFPTSFCVILPPMSSMDFISIYSISVTLI